MDTAAILETLRTSVAGAQIDGESAFSSVQIWDSDEPDAQLAALQSSVGRFALILHEDTAWETERGGLVLKAVEAVNIGILISNKRWPDDSPPDADQPILEVFDAVVGALMGASTAMIDVRPVIGERFRPDPESGRAAARIIYRVGVTAHVRTPRLTRLSL